ncbi:molybdenum cofactor guanylyltransferase [Salipaludibacillus neizhouensis]|nr:molybdenum cofactor guanylyltransferase [Salipaludibacillus neizhouensis]
MEIAGIILAGGKSSRMGTNKALLTVNGEQTIVRLLERLLNIVDEVILVTNDKETYEFLDVQMVTDNEKDRGPLAGLEAGLAASKHSWNLIVACDLPFFEEKIVEVLLHSLKQTACDAVIPLINGRAQPLMALYHRRVLPTIEQSLKENKLRLRDVFTQINSRFVTEEEFLKAGYSEKEIEKLFFNMNNPEDYTWVKSQKSKP